MWPTNVTWLILSVGIIPILFVVWRVMSFGAAELKDLISLQVILLWVAFDASPLYTYITDGNLGDTYIFSPTCMDTLLFFSAAYSISLILGGGVSRKPGELNFSVALLGGRRQAFDNALIFGLICLNLIVFIYNVGGISEALWATQKRALIINDADKTQRYLLTLSRLTSAGLVGVSGMNLVSVRRLPSALIAIVGLVVGSLQNFFTFSRWSGIAFIAVGGLLVSDLRGGRRIIGTIMLVIGLFLNIVGYNARNYADLGVARFLESALALASGSQIEKSDTLRVNFLDYSAIASEKMAFGRSVPEGDVYRIFLNNISPLPSALVEIEDVGWDLAKSRGWTHVNITTPLLAELYLLFGWWSIIIGIIQGMFLRIMQRYIVQKKGFVGTIVFALLIASFVISLHSWIRAVSRIYYLVGLIICVDYVWANRRERHLVD